ncbi:hypothetical protein EVAR_7168_1 [Eumeta japonica]|uniref:Uncharacterized protein n=1 Tax=Eumeta variegata TaxID=151549 RepID=A0A4C1U6F4_EUMVA|nr:hypothetical protein EVAR_7168_1 [Eumeta japonica]
MISVVYRDTIHERPLRRLSEDRGSSTTVVVDAMTTSGTDDLTCSASYTARGLIELELKTPVKGIEPGTFQSEADALNH